MKNALVTGAAGFIGSHVVRQLLDDNIAVRALIRPGENTVNLKGLDIETMEGDILDNARVKKAIAGVDTIFHLAAIYAIWMENWKPIYEVNLQGSRNVLWAAFKSDHIDRVVYTSSISALGVEPGKVLNNETTPFNQYDLGSHYVLTKYLSQQEALGFAANGLNLVVVNPAFPFGPGDIGPTPTGKIIIDVVSGLNMTTFDGGLNIVDVRDVAKGHVLAAQKGKTGQCYILGNVNVTITELMKMIYKAAGRNRSFIPKVPLSIVKGGATAMKLWSDRFSRKPPMSTPVDVSYAANYLYFDNTKARKELGLEFRPVEASLKEAIAWFKKHKMV
ncbi:MAG: NAD-dependent epimerase/dehydratase family protein [Desulfobacteraceae bacterium]|jgi:dihydroflavonol-4-reductase|nr:MAG: NAD-dependent epimerase/dehydratase family protein [Desulfobacteraceae bacterium]